MPTITSLEIEQAIHDADIYSESLGIVYPGLLLTVVPNPGPDLREWILRYWTDIHPLFPLFSSLVGVVRQDYLLRAADRMEEADLAIAADIMWWQECFVRQFNVYLGQGVVTFSQALQAVEDAGNITEGLALIQPLCPIVIAPPEQPVAPPPPPPATPPPTPKIVPPPFAYGTASLLGTLSTIQRMHVSARRRR